METIRVRSANPLVVRSADPPVILRSGPGCDINEYIISFGHVLRGMRTDQAKIGRITERRDDDETIY